MLARNASPRAQQYIKSLPFKPRVPFEQLFPDANPLALDLLRRLLAFDPAERITCDEALRHPYLAVWHDPADEPVCSSKFDFSFEQVDDIESMKKLILNEVISFRREVRLQAQARQQMLRESQASESTGNAQPAVPRRQDSLPVPSREEIERTTPDNAHFPQFGHDAQGAGLAPDRVIGDGSTLEDPHESLDRQLSHYHVQN